MDRAKDIERLKRKGDKAEREAILQRMAEDKVEKAERAAQAKLAEASMAEMASSAGGASSAAAGGSSVASDGDTSALVIRAEQGAFRHSFPAGTTLAAVRDWLLNEQHKREAEARGVGTSHVLASNEDIELVRQGRENFERQTARLREEARAMRMGDGSGAGVTALYFVTLTPKAEYLSEEAMATTTLAGASLVPHGTLMVRRQLVAPPAAPDGPDETEDILRAREEGDEANEGGEAAGGDGHDEAPPAAGRIPAGFLAAMGGGANPAAATGVEQAAGGAVAAGGAGGAVATVGAVAAVGAAAAGDVVRRTIRRLHCGTEGRGFKCASLGHRGHQ